MRILVLLFALAAAADEPKWERKEFECERPEKGCHITTCCQYGLAVYTREKPGIDVKEVKAVGQIGWPLEPIDGGKRTLGTYQLLTDPGGSIPTFIANKANTTALPELFARVRKRAEGN